MQFFRLSLALGNAQNVSAVSLAFLLTRELAKGVMPPLLDAPMMISANPHWPEDVSLPENFVITLEHLHELKALYIFNSLPRPRDHVLRVFLNLSKLLADAKAQVGC